MYLMRNGAQARGPYVYFVSAGPFVKIGYTLDNIMLRVRGIQTCNPNRVHLMAAIHGTRADEARFHDKFLDFWVRGEWFHLKPTLYREIGEIARSDFAVIVPGGAGTITRNTAKARRERKAKIDAVLGASPEPVPKSAPAPDGFLAFLERERNA